MKAQTFSYTQPAIVAATHDAIMRTLAADKESWASLPVPVRYRATGAIRAWQAARELAGVEGAKFLAALANPDILPLNLQVTAASFARANSAFDFSTEEGSRVLRRCASSLYGQAFWARGGALYEPTEAMQSLLSASDLAQDIPLRMIRPPVATMCIVPPVSVRADPEGFEAVTLLSHAAGKTGEEGSRRWLSVVAQKHQWTASLKFEIDDTSDQTVAAALEAMLEQPRVEGHAGNSSSSVKPRLQRVLEYTVKVLLYLSLDNAQYTPERAYSSAPKSFPGLGRRKRELRLAEVERLYDRYLIGPQALTNELASHANGTSGHSVSAHWRRGHFRLQPHGPQASLRKVMFIMPTLVRADRLTEG